MSANVWFEQVNIGLINELKDTVRIKSPNGEYEPLKDNAFIVRKPEEDFKFEVFPCVSVYNKGYSNHLIRYNPEPVVVDVTQTEVILEDSAIPFELDYQIDFWSRYQTDMDAMTMTWLMKHFHQFNLKVIDDGGTERMCNCLINGNIVKSDLVLNKERLFHSIVSYKIWVELDSGIRYNKPRIIEVDIDAR